MSRSKIVLAAWCWLVVSGFAEARRRMRRLGHFFGQFTAFFTVEIENIPGLEGTYHLVAEQWSTVGNGTIPFYVRVAKGSLRTGGAMTFIVKVREGLDL